MNIFRHYKRVFFGALMLAAGLMPTAGMTMGLRAFVALPIEKGGTVLRVQLLRNNDPDIDTAITSFAYGLSHKQTLLFGLPYRLKPSGDNRTGDLSVLYRHIISQTDRKEGTTRLGVLAGAVIPTESQRDEAIQGGLVATFYRGGIEWDLDALYQSGFDQRRDTARYDVSRQYRLTPAEYPEWGIGSEWDIVTELNGRWTEGEILLHQATLGLQWIHQKWVLESGIIQDLNGPGATGFLLSTRFHF